MLKGQLTLPGDKSISHRALMLLTLATGFGVIQNLSTGQDVMSTLGCLQRLGVRIEPVAPHQYRVYGQPQFLNPETPLDCGNSGTTIRLLSGILVGSGVSAELTGDESLKKRPMKRIIEPLSQMGGRIQALGDNHCAPLQIEPPAENLHGIQYRLPVASAQVKSAILLAGLFTPPGETVVIQESVASRDHTERMLKALGVDIYRENECLALKGRRMDLAGQDIEVPGDISSAAFWMVGAAILPGSRIELHRVGLNPLRTGILDKLKEAGAHLEITPTGQSAGEPMGDLVVEGGALQGDIVITPDQVPGLIDEIPILTVLGLFTQGTFSLSGAQELRYKESDRLGAMVSLLKRLKVDVEAYEDGFTFQGNPHFEVPQVDETIPTYHDHRLVMALEILNLRAKKPLPIEGKNWAAVSYPTFYQTLGRLLDAGSGVLG